MLDDDVVKKAAELAAVPLVLCHSVDEITANAALQVVEVEVST